MINPYFQVWRTKQVTIKDITKLTYISLSSYLAARFCRTPGSCKYESLVISSTPPGGASVSFENTFEIFVTT